MRRLTEYSFIAALVFLLLSGCGSRKSESTQEQKVRDFPGELSVPSVITDPQAVLEYGAEHFWDAYLSDAVEYSCDSLRIGGVDSVQLMQALVVYADLLESAPTDFAARCMASFFGGLEETAGKDTTGVIFSFFERNVEKVLYDPNSPFRDEDIYLPFISGLAVSEYSDQNLRLAYEYTASLCGLNRKGTQAADFIFTDAAGKRHSLHGIRAEATILFFSNPGCPACREYIDALSNDETVQAHLADGSLAVADIYIDFELDKWRESLSEIPDAWIAGYDQDFSIRTDASYNVRAIPSLYLLDKDKNVVLKDASVEKVLGAVSGIFSNN